VQVEKSPCSLRYRVFLYKNIWRWRIIVKSENLKLNIDGDESDERGKNVTHKTSKIRIIPLGGLNEIGKNMNAIEYRDKILVLDCGMAFPDDEMLGVDMVIPDISYLTKNADKVCGVVITHGHEDHIGSLPYFLKQINVPVYGTKLTLGLISNKLKEHGILKDTTLVEVGFNQRIDIGPFNVEFIRTGHSIPDSAAIAIHTPMGVILHTGDFKIDYTPVDGQVVDLARLAQLGEEGVLVLMADSTNVERPGYTPSEKIVEETFNRIFQSTEKRIIIATFASNVHRLQQIFNAAFKYGRKVAISGRSMVNVVSVARELGYLDIPGDTMIDLDAVNDYDDDKLVIITTGSQGEPMSALARMAYNEHKVVEIRKGDLIIISASAIPGNEKTVSRIINQLFKRGADVIYEPFQDVHVSGHGCQEEMKLLHQLTRPKFFVPVHGEYRHLRQHSKLAESLGMPPENIFLVDIGTVLEFTKDTGKIAGTVTAGKILVDGLGVGDVGNIVLRDRKHLAQDGLMVVVLTISKENGSIVAGPDIISRGFVYVRESEDLMEEARKIVKDSLATCEKDGVTEWSTLKSVIKDSLRGFLYEKTMRKPMILPIIMEI